ncbi:hypothetical protein [Clostridium manihotivorum]|uniref:Uncharacterized protein n=1 Tax=Clostridium manihotivorum TaxID=2320868 RepID=A0A410DVW6_9CLOT|nr:hypothetical protein [Clostridium manihotivorum]QAA33190.1 hypothetical protein C1I91_16950 [Clostridium manihotivorum]
METLREYVDSLFCKYKEDKQIQELKYEIFTNLEAKVKDLTENGLSYDKAIVMAKESITSIDYLIDGNKEIYINKFKLECLQITLLYSLIIWIVTIPISIVETGRLLNALLLVFSIVLGVNYIGASKEKNKEVLLVKKFFNIRSAYRIRRIAWVLWGGGFIASSIYVTMVRFGSNIWFSRSVKITGPYEFASIVINYCYPFLLIVVPLFINSIPQLLLKYEVGDLNENKK